MYWIYHSHAVIFCLYLLRKQFCFHPIWFHQMILKETSVYHKHQLDSMKNLLKDFGSCLVLHGCEQWWYKRMLRFHWQNRITNAVLQRRNTHICLTEYKETVKTGINCPVQLRVEFAILIEKVVIWSSIEKVECICMKRQISMPS